MKIIVLIKQVPDVSELKFDPVKRTLIREGVRNEINPFDRRAVTYASQLRRTYGGEVVVLTMGPPQARDALIEALAMGADRAVHLLDKAFAGSDTLATSRALSLAIGRERPFDLVMCGKYSVDAETGHVGPEVAELLGIAHVSGATNIEFSSSKRVIVEAETDYGFQWIEAGLPVLVTAAERMIKPIRPVPEEIENAKAKPIQTLSAVELSHDLSLFGFAGSPTAVTEIRSIESKRKCEMIEGSNNEEKASKLVNKLVALGMFSGKVEMGSERKKRSRAHRVTDKRSIWVVTESVRGVTRGVTYELLGRAGELADVLGCEVAAVAFGELHESQVAGMFAYGADRVYLLEGDWLIRYSSDAYASALSEIIQRFRPFAVIGGSTSFGRDFLPRVAAKLGLGMTSDCIGLELDSQGQLVQLKPAFGGSMVAPILSRTVPQMATVRPGIFEPPTPDPSRTGVVTRVKPTHITPLSHLVNERLEVDPKALLLENADIVVGAGAGIGSADNLKIVYDLAEAFGGIVAATRKVVDLGWAARQLQIGLTGKSISPKLYVAVAVRGAFNHMIGIVRARTIIAINNDQNAPIFRNCDYGIVADFKEIVPILTAKLREIRMQVKDKSA